MTPGLETVRALLISYHFPPFGSPGSHRVAAFARHLPSSGVDLTVVTTDEPRFPRLDPSTLDRIPRDVRVVRVGSTASGFHWIARRSLDGIGPVVARLLDRVARPDHAIAWSAIAGAVAGRIAAARGIDRIVTSSPPHSTLLSGAIARAIAGPGTRWVADLRDPLAGGTDTPNGAFSWLPVRALRAADGIVCNTSAMEAAIRADLPAATTTTIPNGYDEDAVDRARRQTPVPRPGRDAFRIVHAGALYGGQRDPVGLIRAIGEAQSRAPRPVRFRLVLAGADPERLPPGVRDAVDRLPPPARVEFPGFLPHDAMLAAMADADLLVLFQPSSFPLQIPSKAYEYIALGRPLLALGAEDGATADLVRGYRRGRVVAHDDVDRIAATLVERAGSGPGDDDAGDDEEIRALAPGRREVSSRLARFLREIAGRG